jgi:spore maturation protein CgeB
VKILYAGAKHDYGDPARGYSFEHYNFYDTLVRMGHDVIYFDFLTELQRRGKRMMNAQLRDMVLSEHPELLFTVLYTDEFDMDVVRWISEHTETVTFNWFTDDHWRFDEYSRYWAPVFNWVSTTAESALPKYRRIGYSSVIKTQWACNHFLYRPLDLPPEYDVTFIGQPHGNRRDVIETLRRAGIDVAVWGYGWDSGKLNQTEMIEVFSRSRINLNLSNASRPVKLRGSWQRLALRKPVLPSQIKGRNFEIPGCGGFLLTDSAENLNEYFIEGTEIVVFNGTRDLVDQVRLFLQRSDERQQIAYAGYRRTLKDHTYELRFRQIFHRMGLVSLDHAVPFETGEVDT